MSIEVFLETVRHAGPLLILAMIILCGVAFGELARLIRIPSITGQIVAGILLGKSGFDLFAEESLHGLAPLTNFALGLIAVTVGAHLNIKRLRNAGRRLFLLLLTESTITPSVVFLSLWMLADVPTSEALLYATVAIATAPATTVALVRETRSKGVFVKTLIAAVALNNMACLVLFEVVRSVTGSWNLGGSDAAINWQAPVGQLLAAVAIGGAVAIAMDLINRFVVHKERLATAAVAALVLTSGLAATFDVSPILACLFLGIIQTNITPSRSQLVDSTFADFEPAILTVFFTLAGMHMSLEHAATAGVVSGLLFGSRIAGKVLAANLAMRFANATDRVRKNLGLALIPQAGVAVGLVVVLQADPAFSGLADQFAAVVLTVVTFNEILGPLLTRYSLERAGEIGRDRMRLIDFLQEENIAVGFQAETKTQAIEKLVDLLISSHDMRGVDKQTLLDSVLAREAEASTCLGGGLSVPHGILPNLLPMVGVMALSREGLHFDTPDGRPVHCMVLLGTANDERDRHLQVLATLASNVGTDHAFQEQLFNANSPAHAYEILHGDESEAFNFFLDDES
ncbi:MAG: Kef-type K+ transport system membrane component KefB/mannitol [Myxococcota bacterium]|jgi:Kef-type K+ transport system membrane component KefB/mannitol/fructose-specific phosphotransferase system IIA component (Ntr-type)